ncbi:MAG: SMC-Scp complex subunit ScpB [Nanobdellota archaeon]
MTKLKNKIEALLFSSGRRMCAEELCRLIGVKSHQEVKKSVKELKEVYDNLDSSIMIIQEGDGWKMTIREKYLPLVRNINPYTELSKTVLETLAVIAWKSPVLQSTIIKLRTNKAYDHINDLEELGFIVREKYGRTFVLKLTQKFFEYFDLENKRDISKIFKDVQSIEPEEQLQMNEFDSDEADKVAGELQSAESGEDVSFDEKESDRLDAKEMEIIDEISEIEEYESNKTNTNKS